MWRIGIVPAQSQARKCERTLLSWDCTFNVVLGWRTRILTSSPGPPCLIPEYRVHNTGMHIGELARKAAVNIQTIRFYEREGLLPVPARNHSGYRCYETVDLERVTFIKRNQELGFTLDEIRQLLDLHRVVAAMTYPLRHKPTELRAIIAIRRERLEVIEQKVRTLHTMRRR